MTPQMSVTPSRPLATKGSGGTQPVARRAASSARPRVHSRDPSNERRNSWTGARSTRDQDFAVNRQLFLTEQGYSYRILDASEVPGGLEHAAATPRTREPT